MPHCRLLTLCSLLVASPLAALASSPAPAPGAFWPACTTAHQWYCVVSATFDGNPMTVANDIATSYPGAGMVWAVRFFTNAGLDTVNWEARDEGGFSFFPPRYLTSQLQVVMNTGTSQPSWTTARADQFHMKVSTDTDGSYLLTLQGTGVEMNSIVSRPCNIADCGDQSTRADYYGTYFSGDTFLYATQQAAFDGMYVATNAQNYSTPAFTKSGVFLQIANPHLGVDGGPTSGSYTFWVPPRYLTSIGMTVDSALDGGIEFDRFDPSPDAGYDGGIQFADDGGVLNGSVTQLTPTLTSDDDGPAGTGIIMRLDSLHYSTPTVVVRKRGGNAQTTPPASHSGCSATGNALSWAAAGLAMVAWITRRRRSSTPR